MKGQMRWKLIALLKTIWHLPGIHEIGLFVYQKWRIFWHCWVTRLDLEKIRQQVFLLQESGLASPQQRSPRLIVSFTSFPDRISEVFAVAYSLLTQSLKPDAVILWLAEEEFPHKEKDLPQELLYLQSYGLSIQWCENLLSYKKLVPALQRYPEDIIVTADDDIYYPPDWLEPLYTAYLADPTSVQAHAAGVACDDTGGILPLSSRKYLLSWFHEAPVPSYRYCQVGGPGVLYPPHCLHKDVCRTDVFLEQCSANDDEWFWAMAILGGTKVHCLKQKCGALRFIDPKRQYLPGVRQSLLSFNKGVEGDLQRAAIPALYPEMRTILRRSSS
ncbi:MAG: glycosyltransferase [Holosporales bacterium]|jgi:hypothetical protein|nr:glycosyltransferase [Holosporales bacterium]